MRWLAKNIVMCSLCAGCFAPASAHGEEGTVQKQTETRVAIVANSAPARSVAELTVAELSKAPGIVLVEREDVGTLFREIETALLAGGMHRLSDRIREYGTDLFAVFYADEKEPSIAFIVFDAETGVRLADRALRAAEPDAQAREASAALGQASDKRRLIDAGTLKTVSVVAIRNLDLPTQERAFVHAVGYLFEQTVVNASGFALLERRALEWVNRERMQIAPEAAARLKSGRLQMEIEVGRAADGVGRKATLHIADGEGRPVARVESETAHADALALAADLFAQLTRALAVQSADVQPDLRREADRLFAEFLFLYGHKRYEPALERLEACAALYPERAFPYLAAALLHAGGTMLRGRQRNVAKALDYGERAMALWQERHRRNPLLRIPRDGRVVVEGTPDDGYFEKHFFHRLVTFSGAEALAPELQQRRIELLRTYALLIAERGVARNAIDEAVETLGYYHKTKLLSFWIEHRPEDFEAWFESVTQSSARYLETGRMVKHQRAPGMVGQALRLILRDTAISAATQNGARRLLARYNELDLDSLAVLTPKTVQANIPPEASLDMARPEDKQRAAINAQGLMQPWKSTARLLEGRMVFVVHDDRHIYAGHIVGGQTLAISRIAVADWKPVEINRIPGPFSTRYLRYGNPLENARARTALSPENLFVGTHAGVWIVPLSGRPPRRLTTENGLPSNAVQSLAWLDGMLYLALGVEDREMWIVRHDIGRDHTDLLLSSGRLGSDHPVEKLSRPPRIRGIEADSERRTLWLLACLQGAEPNLDAEGLWSYKPDKNEWHHAIAHNWDYNVRMHRHDHTLLIASAGLYAVCYDLAEQRTSRLWVGRNDYDNIARLAKPAGTLRTDTSYASPFVATDDWLWASDPFVRVHWTTGEKQALPSPSGGQKSIVGVVDQGRSLLVVVGNGLWSLEREKREP